MGNDNTHLKVSSHPSGRLTLMVRGPGEPLFADASVPNHETKLRGNLDHAEFWHGVAAFMGALANAGQSFTWENDGFLQ